MSVAGAGTGRQMPARKDKAMTTDDVILRKLEKSRVPASCAGANQTVRARRYYDRARDGLAHPWSGRVWMNPPYGAAAGAFVGRLVEAHRAADVPAAIMLVSAHATDVDWFAPLWDFPLCFCDHRIRFEHPTRRGSSPTFGTAFAYLGPDPAGFADRFDAFGTVVARFAAT